MAARPTLKWTRDSEQTAMRVVIAPHVGSHHLSDIVVTVTDIGHMGIVMEELARGIDRAAERISGARGDSWPSEPA